MFGTSFEEALPGLFNIRNRLAAAFPDATVHYAFTSKIIRRIWQQRAEDPDYFRHHPGIPPEILRIRDPLTVIDDLRKAGCGGIVVQPIYMIPGAEYSLLLAEIKALELPISLLLGVGKPVLREKGNAEDFLTLARALAGDANYAESQGAALIYMGHGSRHGSSEEIYQGFAAAMNRLHPGVLTVVATVEGEPALDRIINQLQDQGISKVVLKPLMVAAGSHIRLDMVGPRPRGWKIRLEEAGFSVAAVLEGLGEQNGFTEILIRRAADAAACAGIELHEQKD